MSSNQIEIRSERVDDIPVIVEWLKQMEIAKWIDQKLSQPHGNHQGLRYYLTWRLYVTNAPSAQLSLPQAILYYRAEWVLERGFHRFKRGNLPILPIYFKNQDRIAGLMFLLTIALRVFTLIEFVVRLALQTTQQSLAGLYDGNPKRTTDRPSAEQLLKAFSNLTLYFLPDASLFVTPLSELQRQILALMKLPDSLYQLHLKPGQT